MQIPSFIDGAFYKTDSQLIKSNPFTGEKLHEVSSCDLMGVVMAIQSSNKAFQNWKVSTLDQRRDLITKIQNHLSENTNSYCQLEALDQALPIDAVKKYSLALILKNIDEVKKQNPLSEFQYSPVGVVVIVASWNLSLRVIMDRLIPALMAGNSVIIKISSESPITAFIFSEMIKACDVPAGLINVIVSSDVEVKRALISHPGVKAVSFTGCLETVNEVLPLLTHSSIQSFKKIQIGSGSKNSAVVLTEPHDSVFDKIMQSFLLGQGQLVWSSSRLFVLEKFENQWTERIADYLKSIKPSEGISDDSVWTPCLKMKSFYNFSDIKRQSLDDQAKLLEVSAQLTEPQKKLFLPPIFTKDMSRCSTLQQDQIHSPFYILSTVKYPFDVAKYSNVSYYGFAAHLWGEVEKLEKVAESLDVGLVTCNKSSIEIQGASASVKQSGFGLQDYQSFGAFFSNVKKMS